ncbi:MAG: hypothetical protein WC384_10315 [Prolixibacteraceae bacterium]|jgi:hypothetical protein
METKRTLLFPLLLVAFLIVASGCGVIYPQYRSRTVIISTNPSGKVPPGQMKKATGAQNAKDYAPGQQKKHKRK